ncbi:MAG: replication-associated recombination protein A [Bacteroidales bacterium]
MQSTAQPLADRMRPRTLDEYVGQEHLVGKNAPLRKIIESGNIPSMIFWGPPGVGKTTLAQLIASASQRAFFTLSAVHSGVKEVREAIERSEKQRFFGGAPILFIDEIHRFSKSQQDSLLHAVEKGIIVLIGATTENPSFEVISPLLSRCQVFVLNPLSDEQLKILLRRAIDEDLQLKHMQIQLQETEALLRISGGDARKLLNALEIVVQASGGNAIVITDSLVQETIQKNIALYDKQGEQHYNLISAFIKSVRGSDPNAAVYYLARMLAAGEDIEFIARRLIILAAEDIGLANPNALMLANNCFQAIHNIGMPEARIILSETVIYLATSPKSNSAYLAIDAALEKVDKTGDLPVPLHLRNAPTSLMKNLGYGKNYAYAHDYDDNFVNQEYLPESIKGTCFYTPGSNSRENEMRHFLKTRWKNKYGY